MFSLLRFLIMSNLCMDHSDPFCYLLSPQHLTCLAAVSPRECLASQGFSYSVLSWELAQLLKSTPKCVYSLLRYIRARLTLTQQTVVSGCIPRMPMWGYSVSFMWSTAFQSAFYYRDKCHGQEQPWRKWFISS